MGRGQVLTTALLQSFCHNYLLSWSAAIAGRLSPSDRPHNQALMGLDVVPRELQGRRCDAQRRDRPSSSFHGECRVCRSAACGRSSVRSDLTTPATTHSGWWICGPSKKGERGAPVARGRVV